MKTNTFDTIKALTGITALVLLVIALIIFGPLASIAAINTLFGTGIAYNIWTWLSAFWVQILFFGKFKS